MTCTATVSQREFNDPYYDCDNEMDADITPIALLTCQHMFALVSIPLVTGIMFGSLL